MTDFPSSPVSETPFVKSFTGSTKDSRCLEVWFDNEVTNATRAWLLEAINEKALRGHAPTPTEPTVDEQIVDAINYLRGGEGDSVTILCDNPDFDGQPNCAIECNGDWTRWEDKRFTGGTILVALQCAYIECQQWRRALEYGREKFFGPSDSSTSHDSAPRVPKVRTSHHRNKEEAARLQELVDKRFAPTVSSPEHKP